MTRAFLVQRVHTVVHVREVDPSSCAFTLDHAESWQRVKALCRAAKKSQTPSRRCKATGVVVTALDGTSRSIDVPA